MLEALDSNCNFVSILVNCVIAICALNAFWQSKKARRYASFETVYSQMIAVMRDFFDNKYIENTRLKKAHFTRGKYRISIRIKFKRCRIYLNASNPITMSFVQYYKQIIYSHKYAIFLDADIVLIYRLFMKNLEYEEYFNNCFKFIYNIVMLVEKSDLSEDEKRKYMERSQALLNKNELFCYLINLIVYYYDKDMQNIEYLKLLSKYNFFGDLFQSRTFSEIIKKGIPQNILIYFKNNGL